MRPSVLRHTKAIYSLITTFLFIMVVLFVVIAMIYLSEKMKVVRGDVNDVVQKYDDIRDVKNILLSQECHGTILRLDGDFPVNRTCELPPGSAKGYVIVMEAFPNCTNESRQWVHRFSQEEAEEQPYFVKIQSNETGNICPGTLKVLI